MLCIKLKEMLYFIKKILFIMVYNYVWWVLLLCWVNGKNVLRWLDEYIELNICSKIIIMKIVWGLKMVRIYDGKNVMM